MDFAVRTRIPADQKNYKAAKTGSICMLYKENNFRS